MDETERVFTLQTDLLGFICKVVANYSPRIWQPYWDRIAEIETETQKQAFLTQYGFAEKYNNYKKGEKNNGNNQ